jgi:pimeloyl-ACP methyl ester carboxylesterase
MRVDTPLGRLSVAVIAGPRPIAVLWHGLFTDSQSWMRLSSELSEDRTLVLVDGPGFGGSDALERVEPDFVAACADAAEAVIAAVQRDLAPGPVDWVGGTSGGQIGLHLAATRPALIRSLVTVSSPVRRPTAAIRRQVRLLVPVYRAIGMRRPVRAGLLKAMLTDDSRRSDPVAVDAVVRPMSRPGRRGTANAVRSGVLLRGDLRPLCGRVRCPTLMVATDDRGEWSPEECAEAVALTPNARGATISGSRSLPALERPAELTALIREFWRTR